MHVVYVAGPYTAKASYLVEKNIDIAKELAMDVWKMGAVALCPHLNSQHFEGCASSQAFIDGTLELMRRCDSVLVCPNWETSVGTKGEITEAIRLGLPVFYSLKDLSIYLAHLDVDDNL